MYAESDPRRSVSPDINMNSTIMGKKKKKKGKKGAAKKNHEPHAE